MVYSRRRGREALIVTATFRISDYDVMADPAGIVLDVLRKFAKRVYEVEILEKERDTRVKNCLIRSIFTPSNFPAGIKELENDLHKAFLEAELASLGEATKRFYSSGVTIQKMVFERRDWSTYLTKKVFDKVTGNG